MRRGFAVMLLCAVALSWTTGLTARRELPPCCKAHGCAMMKRAAHGCAFSRCDQNETATTAARQICAVLAAESELVHARRASPLEPLAEREMLFVYAAAIDHPPRLLLL